jgi:predicted RNA-binding Zn-ribbon protein involved in translation (DUF1610 family)
MNLSPHITVSHPRKAQTLAKLMWQTKISHNTILTQTSVDTQHRAVTAHNQFQHHTTHNFHDQGIIYSNHSPKCYKTSPEMRPQNGTGTQFLCPQCRKTPQLRYLKSRTTAWYSYGGLVETTNKRTQILN